MPRLVPRQWRPSSVWLEAAESGAGSLREDSGLAGGGGFVVSWAVRFLCILTCLNFRFGLGDIVLACHIKYQPKLFRFIQHPQKQTTCRKTKLAGTIHHDTIFSGDM